MHFTRHRDNRRQPQVGKNNPPGADRRLNARHAKRRNPLHVQIFRLEKGKQGDDNRQRHQKLQNTDDVVGAGERFYAVVVQAKEETQQ
ncbi:hypothetical protein D3C84_956470 [compost metagenome]